MKFGLIESLARPGGNITGVSVDAGLEVWGKRLELLTEVVGKQLNIVFVSTKGGWDGAGGLAARDTAKKLGVNLVLAPVSLPVTEEACRHAIDLIQRDQVGGVMFADEGELYTQRLLLVRLVQQVRVPAIFVYREQTEVGGLISYSYDFKAASRTGAMQIVRILHGAKPSDTPYMQETHFELVINNKAAKEFGLKISPLMVSRADEVIE